MKTDCNRETIYFQTLNGREVVGEFNGGHISSDGGGLILKELEDRLGIIQGFSECFEDHRDQDMIEHSLYDLLCQRVFGLALGYEDLNDHDELRKDPALAVMVGKGDPTGRDRLRDQDKGKALAGKSTLNRLELGPLNKGGISRYKKIVFSDEKFSTFLVDVFIKQHAQSPEEIILDLDATDDPLHGNQEGKFYHGYYHCYCYLPLYIFCGDHLLCGLLRRSNIDAYSGSLEEVKRIVKQIRSRWPEVRIIVRGDSGFCRDELMSWCESNGVKYVFGLAKNSRLQSELSSTMKYARFMSNHLDVSTKYYNEFTYKTLKSWSCERRVVGKAEYLSKGANPRFVVTNFSRDDYSARDLYEVLYCARGEMENKIKEQQLCLFADRTSTSELHSNQIRLNLSSVAYLLVSAVRRLGLIGTKLEKAQCDTIRLKLLKIGVHVRVTVRKIWFHWASAYPYVDIFNRALENIKKVNRAMHLTLPHTICSMWTWKITQQPSSSLKVALRQRRLAVSIFTIFVGQTALVVPIVATPSSG